MKLKFKMNILETGGEILAVPVGIDCDFNGMLRLNRTAQAVIEYLNEDTDTESVVKHMLERFEGGEEQIRSGVNSVIDILRGSGLLEE